MADVNLVTLLQLKTASERIASMISGLLTDEEVASLVDDAELEAMKVELKNEHQNLLAKIEEVLTACSYDSAEEASF